MDAMESKSERARSADSVDLGLDGDPEDEDAGVTLAAEDLIDEVPEDEERAEVPLEGVDKMSPATCRIAPGPFAIFPLEVRD